MQKSRFFSAYSFILIVFVILFLRYTVLQIFMHKTLATEAINNYSAEITTLPIRGDIIDKNGIILANNKASYAVSALPKDIKAHLPEILKHLSKYVDITTLDHKKLIAQLKNAKAYNWVIIKDDLNNKEVANLIAHRYEIPEVNVFARIKRVYPFDNMYAHSIGYVGHISAADKNELIKKNIAINYLNNDYIGKSGLENYYESYLRGSLGKKIIKTDAHGNEIGFIDNISAHDGYTVQLTLDHKLQELAWNLLGNRKGAVIAIDPNTGGILTFVSKPAFNPNWFIDGIDVDDWDDLVNNPAKPLLNRAIQGTYPPGSTFKPFMALTALDLGFRTPNSTYYDTGYFVIPGSKHIFHDSARNGHGLINLTQAIYYSSDTYFYKLGLDMGIDNADKVLPLFGFGAKTGIDIPKEKSGLLPSKEWKSKRFSSNPYQKNWLIADNIPFAVGQGFNHYTPLQMAHAMSIIANGGLNIKPHFLYKVIDENGHTVYIYTPTANALPIQKSYFDFIKSALQKVVTMGTAHGIANNLKYTMAGKTGTAQVVALKQNSHQAKFSGEEYRDHAWFIAFAPVDHPKIALAVLVENGGWGASTAAPIARALCDEYLLPKESAPLINNPEIFHPKTESLDNNKSDEDEDNDD